MGSIWQVKMGPRGMIVGCGVGGVLGLSAGISTWGLLKLSGETLEERWGREFKYIQVFIVTL